MKRILICILLTAICNSAALAQDSEYYWAREFAPLPNLVITFNGIGDDGSMVEFTTIYYVREKMLAEPGYWLSEYNIFPSDRDDPDFVPKATMDYYLNEQGFWGRTPYEKSQGLAPGLLLPYKFTAGQVFVGRDDVSYTIANTDVKVKEHGHEYEYCLEVVNEAGDQFFYMPETGLVLSRGYDEHWMMKHERLSPEQIEKHYKVR